MFHLTYYHGKMANLVIDVTAAMLTLRNAAASTSEVQRDSPSSHALIGASKISANWIAASLSGRINAPRR